MITGGILDHSHSKVPTFKGYGVSLNVECRQAVRQRSPPAISQRISQLSSHPGRVSRYFV